MATKNPLALALRPEHRKRYELVRDVKIALLMLSDPPAHQPTFVPRVFSLDPEYCEEGDENAGLDN